MPIGDLPLIHRATIDTAVTLARDGLIVVDPANVDDDTGTGPLPGLEVALAALDVRPPPTYLDRLRARFPRVYDVADASPTAGPADLMRELTRSALNAYATDLLDLADLIAAYEVDPASTYEQHHDTDGLRIGLGMAGLDELDRLRDDYDALIGASYAATHQPG